MGPVVRIRSHSLDGFEKTLCMAKRRRRIWGCELENFEIERWDVGAY